MLLYMSLSQPQALAPLLSYPPAQKHVQRKLTPHQEEPATNSDLQENV